MKRNGFTLVEVLVAIALLSIFGVLIVTIFTRTLRGGNKTQIITAIKQNGQSVLEIMDKTIRNADNVVCLSNDSKTLVVVKDGLYTRYRFTDPRPSSNPTVNGFIEQDNPVKGTDPSTGREYADPAFVNKVCFANDPMDQSTLTLLTNTQAQSGVSVENGSFTKDPSAGYKDQVTIKFDLKPGVQAPQAVAGQIDSVHFQTTIQLR